MLFFVHHMWWWWWVSREFVLRFQSRSCIVSNFNIFTYTRQTTRRSLLMYARLFQCFFLFLAGLIIQSHARTSERHMGRGLIELSQLIKVDWGFRKCRMRFVINAETKKRNSVWACCWLVWCYISLRKHISSQSEVIKVCLKVQQIFHVISPI